MPLLGIKGDLLSNNFIANGFFISTFKYTPNQKIQLTVGTLPIQLSVDEIERISGESIPVADFLKHDKPRQSWIIPRGCNKG